MLEKISLALGHVTYVHAQPLLPRQKLLPLYMKDFFERKMDCSFVALRFVKTVKTQPRSMNACPGVRAKLEGLQVDLACQVSRLLGGSKRRWRQRWLGYYETKFAGHMEMLCCCCRFCRRLVSRCQNLRLTWTRLSSLGAASADTLLLSQQLCHARIFRVQRALSDRSVGSWIVLPGKSGWNSLT